MSTEIHYLTVYLHGTVLLNLPQKCKLRPLGVANAVVLPMLIFFFNPFLIYVVLHSEKGLGLYTEQFFSGFRAAQTFQLLLCSLTAGMKTLALLVT